MLYALAVVNNLMEHPVSVNRRREFCWR